MARMVECVVLKREAEGLNEPPHPGEIGKQPHADESIELLAEHGERCVVVRSDATLRQALDAMDRDDANVAAITGSSKRDSGIVQGILTRAQIDAAVRYGG